jgi:hypothetical protein
MKINIHFGTAGIILDVNLVRRDGEWYCFSYVDGVKISGTGFDIDKAVREFEISFRES